MDREHLERLLREPNNLFGPPRGSGYNYLKNGAIAGVLALSLLSAFVFPQFLFAQNVFLRIFCSLIAMPYTLGSLILWPVDVLGYFSAFGVWYATLRWSLSRWEKTGHPIRWKVAAGIGWTLAAVRTVFLW